MMNHQRVRKAQAEVVLRMVIERHDAYIRAGMVSGAGYRKPTLTRDWYWSAQSDEMAPWAIIWEEGPFQWAYRFTTGGIDPELAELAKEFNMHVAEEEPATLPSDLHVEPIYSYALGIWPA